MARLPFFLDCISSRWLGGNFSQEKYMGYSITGIMAQNIMGIQLAGTDFSRLFFSLAAIAFLIVISAIFINIVVLIESD